MPGLDEEIIVQTPTAPMTDVYISDAAWTGRNRCNPTGNKLFQVPMPGELVVPNSTYNVGASFLMPDRRTIMQLQPLARCWANSLATAYATFGNVDLYGDGILGAHGGSRLSSIGGAIRVGELRPGQATGPRHALKVDVYAKEALFRCSTPSDCYRWPASTADSYAVGWYGSANNNSNREMKMGALLAIPASRDLASLNLKTGAAKQLAWTLQNYGAYIVDDGWAPGFVFSVENGPAGSVAKQFKADWGFDMEQRLASNSDWIHDMQKLVEALYVVANNGPNSIGGGGKPLQPLASAIKP
jgi:hypothetical protein